MDHERHEKHEKLLFKDESYAIQGAIFEVYREMGSGFLEGVYQECMEREFRQRDIPHKSQPCLELIYKGKKLRQTYQPDFICYDDIVLEIKAVREFVPGHKAQLLNYLKATGKRLGLLVNFGSYPKALIQRMAL